MPSGWMDESRVHFADLFKARESGIITHEELKRKMEEGIFSALGINWWERPVP